MINKIYISLIRLKLFLSFNFYSLFDIILFSILFISILDLYVNFLNFIFITECSPKVLGSKQIFKDNCDIILKKILKPKEIHIKTTEVLQTIDLFKKNLESGNDNLFVVNLLTPEEYNKFNPNKYAYADIGIVEYSKNANKYSMLESWECKQVLSEKDYTVQAKLNLLQRYNNSYGLWFDYIDPLLKMESKKSFNEVIKTFSNYPILPETNFELSSYENFRTKNIPLFKYTCLNESMNMSNLILEEDSTVFKEIKEIVIEITNKNQEHKNGLYSYASDYSLENKNQVPNEIGKHCKKERSLLINSNRYREE